MMIDDVSNKKYNYEEIDRSSGGHYNIEPLNLNPMIIPQVINNSPKQTSKHVKKTRKDGQGRK